MRTLAIDKGFLKDLGKLEKPVYNGDERLQIQFTEVTAAARGRSNPRLPPVPV